MSKMIEEIKKINEAYKEEYIKKTERNNELRKNYIPKKKIENIIDKLNNEYIKIDESIDIYKEGDDRGKVDCLQMISWLEQELQELLN